MSANAHECEIAPIAVKLGEENNNLKALLKRAIEVLMLIERARFQNGDPMDHFSARSMASSLMEEIKAGQGVGS